MLLTTRCPGCGTRSSGPVPCTACVERLVVPAEVHVPPGLASCVAVVAYAGPTPAVVVAMKHRRGRAAVEPLAAAVAALVDPATVDVVTWAPTSPARRRRRGHDQAQALALGVARHLRRPCRRLLVRLPGPAQHGRTRADRLAGPAFLGRRSRGRVLVVDDVVTTGATLAAAAAALRRGGAQEVHAAVVAAAVAPGRILGTKP